MAEAMVLEKGETCYSKIKHVSVPIRQLLAQMKQQAVPLEMRRLKLDFVVSSNIQAVSPKKRLTIEVLMSNVHTSLGGTFANK